jgi:hypothetical protein
VAIDSKVADGYHTALEAERAAALKKKSRILRTALPAKRPALLRVATDVPRILSEYLPSQYTSNIDAFIAVCCLPAGHHHRHC